MLCFSDGQEVGVVYYRAGYSPVNYPTEKVFVIFKFVDSDIPTVMVTGVKHICRPLLYSLLELISKYLTNVALLRRYRIEYNHQALISLS